MAEDVDPSALMQELETSGDFDKLDLIEVIDDALGEGEGQTVMDYMAKQQIDPDGSIDFLVQKVIQFVWQIDGEKAMRKFIETMEDFRLDERGDPDRSLADLVNFSVPTTGIEAYTQVGELVDYLSDTFKEDPIMRRFVRHSWEEMLDEVNFNSDGTPKDQLSFTDNAIDPVTWNPEELANRVKGMLATGGLKSLTTDEERAATAVLLDALHEEWESGRADLPFDHPERDPMGIVKEVEEANNSPRSRNLIADNGIESRRIKFTDPFISRGLGEITNDQRQSLDHARRNPSWDSYSMEERSGLIDEALRRSQKEVVDYVWETSSLAFDPLGEGEERDPDQVVNSEMGREHIEMMLGLDIEVATKDIATTGNTGVYFDGLIGSANRVMTKIDMEAAEARRNDEQFLLGGTLAFGPFPPIPKSRFGAQAPTTVGELNQYFFEMSDNRFREIQLGAWQAGKYVGIDVADVPFGDRTDPVARGHWNAAVRESADADRLGIFQTVEDILVNASEGGLATRRRQVEDLRSEATFDRDSAARISAEKSAIFPLHPLSIARRADLMAQEVLGRDATAEEKRLLVGLVQKQDRENQVTIARFNAGQRASAKLEEALTAEAEAGRLEAQIEAEMEEADIRSKAVTDRQVRGDTAPGMELPDAQTMDSFVNREVDIGNLQENQTQQVEATGDVTDGSDTVIEEFEVFDANAFMSNWLKENNAGEVQELGVRESFQTFLNALRSPTGASR